MLSVVANPTMPTSWKRLAGPLSSTWMVSPTCSLAFLAVIASIATSPSPVGARPCLTLRLSCRDPGAMSTASDGAPPVLTGLPSRPTTWAKPLTLPLASVTPSTCRIRSSTACGTGARSAVASSAPNGEVPRTATAVPALMVVNSRSNTTPSESVSTRVPVTNDTPSRTASPDSSSRSLRASRLLIVARNISRCPRPRSASSGPGPSRPLGRGSRRRATRRPGRPPARRTTQRWGRG